MSLVKHTPMDLDWPNWFRGRFLEWPDSLKDAMEWADIRVEEFQENGELVVRAEMPGIDPDKDVEITVSEHTLHLKAERREQTKTEDKKGFRSEFRYGSFARSVSLPVGATEADVKAKYADGILEVRVPIDASEAASKKIPIARG